MTTFSRWSGVVQTALKKFYPKLKLNQAREILSAALGHRTYAALQMHDLDALANDAKYILIDQEAALERAAGLGFPVTPEQWGSVMQALTRSGVSDGRWITELAYMGSAARVVFEDASHPVLDEIAKAVGVSDGHWAGVAQRVSSAEALPQELIYEVSGKVQAFNDEASLATPVVARVMFRRVGKQMYALGKMLDVRRDGEPAAYEPNFDADIYGMSED